MNDPREATQERVVRQGVEALRRGDHRTAAAAFGRLVASGRASPEIWLLLAHAHEQAGSHAPMVAALEKVLESEPHNPYALVMGGESFARAGDDRAAADWFARALGAAAGRQVSAELARRLRGAEAALQAIRCRFQSQLDAALRTSGIDAAVVDAAGGHGRFAEALSILSGNSQPYPQAPTSFFYPRLPHIPFYDPDGFHWATRLKAAFPAIRAEAEAVLAHGRNIAPYVEKLRDRPSHGHALVGDPRWSAFHLYRDGVPVPENSARCPATMAALAEVPLPFVKGRSPMALFSILRPGTHIPPHHGMLNTRLICHLPLIVPDGCRLRVGAETRTVREGEILLFDDSVEHEAWNGSAALRVVLLFEVWRPELSEAERGALTTIFESVTRYGADAG